MIDLKETQIVFSQGEPADAVFYILHGKLRLTVISPGGKEGVVALLGPGDFLGEECIANSQALRMATAAAITESSVLKIEKKEMVRTLHEQHALSDIFVSYLLSRNRRVQEDLIDQLFNSSEKRLARALLLLAQFGKEGAPETVIPKISQETLAEMVGTTRSRVNFFMNRFRKLGFIEYNGKLLVHRSLLSVVLHN
jgi:CRP-like cAMP-binding protein